MYLSIAGERTKTGFWGRCIPQTLTHYRHSRAAEISLRRSQVAHVRRQALIRSVPATLAANRKIKLHHRIERIPARTSLYLIDESEAMRSIRGTVVVWWYERIKKNHSAESIPFVDVIFRFLNDNDELGEMIAAEIGVSRLGSFRLGTIWEDGKCIAETRFGVGIDSYFSVSFTAETWSFMSIKGRDEQYPFFKNYPLRSLPTDDVLTDLLCFQSDGNQRLLIPCIEFLYRCYGSTSDMARILVTYPWDRVTDLLYSDNREDADSWLVQPRPYIPDDDALFLAWARYDTNTQDAAKLLYAQLDNAHGKKIKATSLQVRPWFQGVAQLRVKGIWLDDGKTFLCLEVTGMSQPQTHPYEIRRDKLSTQRLQATERQHKLARVKRELTKQQDPFVITDLLEPDKDSFSWAKPDPDFEIQGPKCSYTTSFEERQSPPRRTVRIPASDKNLLSTGDPTGYNKDVNKITTVAKRVVGDGGILTAMWEELKRLKGVKKEFSSLAWQSETQGFVQDSNFKLLSLPDFSEADSPSDAAWRWLSYPANANHARGMLVIRATIGNRTFYLIELQRKKVLAKTVYGEEKISGLLMEINSATEAAIEISRIRDRIRFYRGNFKKLRVTHPHKIYRHLPSTTSTVYHAFNNMDVSLA